MQKTKVSLSQIKILKTVNDLNNLHGYPTSTGVSNILNGIINEETLPLQHLETFSTLLSLRGRKINTQITQLIRYEYLKYYYVGQSLVKYLEITQKGKSLLLKEESERKIVYKKQNTKRNLEIYFKK